MSFDGLCDHRAVVYRSTKGVDDLQDVTDDWQPLAAPAGNNCRPNQAWGGSQQDRGPGEQQGSTRMWGLVAGFDVRENDILRLVAGPEAPKLLRVLSVDRPTGRTGVVHHLEVNAEVWYGSVDG